MKKLISFILLVLLLQTGCGPDRTRDLFQDAETLMASAPDSALRLVESIDPAALRSWALRARHALLRSQALDKNGIDLRSDSVIAPAVAYYTRHGSKRDKAYMYYYLGRIRNNAGQVGEAAEAMKAAEKYARPIGETYLLGLIYNCQANLYFSQYSLKEALSMCEKADSCFRLKGKVVFSGYMLQAKAKTYALMQDYQASQKEYLKALKIFDSINNRNQVCLISSSIAYQMKHDKEISTDSIKHFLHNIYARHTSGIIPNIDYPIWADIYSRENKIDSARHYYKLIDKKQLRSADHECALHALLGRLEKTSGNFLDASMHWEKAYSLLDSITRYEKENLIQRIEQRYENKELQHRNEVLHLRNRSYIYFGALILTVLLSGFVLLLRRRQEIIHRQEEESKKREAYLEALNENYEALQARYDEFMKSADSRSEAEENLMKAVEKRLTDMKRLLGIAYTGNCNPQVFYNAFKEYATSLKKDEHAFTDLRYIINKRYDGIVDYLIQRFPKLTNSEVNMLCMLLYGFPYNCIRLIFNHDNTDSLYSRRNKLREKLGLPPGTGKKIEKYLFQWAEELKAEKEKSAESEN
ncbi:hypothetical protein [Alistipes sp.]|uniref:hypothetical protein n=1 Tax=Alistipes sp. TaxID=1872444 RepID=UPI003AF1ADF9